KLIAKRNPKNRRYYTHKQYIDYIGESTKGKTIIYTRDSSSNQKDDLEKQVEYLKQYDKAKGVIVDEVFTDIGSGLNYNRKKWNSLLQNAILGHSSKISIAHNDRFIRFGYDWFEKFLESDGVEIVVVNNEKLSPEAELA